MNNDDNQNQYIFLPHIFDGNGSINRNQHIFETHLKNTRDIDFHLLSNKVLTMQVLKIQKNEKSTIYLPGIIDYKYHFFECPFKIRNVHFNNIEHLSDGAFILNVSMHESRPKDTLSKFVIERKIKLPLTLIKLAFDVIDFINILIDKEISTSEITTHLKHSPYHIRYSEKSIFYFVKNCTLKSWSEISSRVGKDNRMSGGLIIENFPNDKYLISLTTRLGYNLTDDNRLKSYDDDDYGFVASHPYQESVIENEEIKFELMSSLIKSYNWEMHVASLLLEK